MITLNPWVLAFLAALFGPPPEPSCWDDQYLHMEAECRWWVCKDGTCLAMQMCWRMDEDGQARCTFWDYPDDTMCCPDTAGQTVKGEVVCE